MAVILLLAPNLPGPVRATDDDYGAAQRRANQAAEALAKAVEEGARADDTVADLERRVARVDARVAAVRGQVADLAVRQYVQSTLRITRLLRMADANELVRANQFASVVASTSTDALERYRADKEDLRTEAAALRRGRQAQAGAIADLRQRQDDAVKELDRLARLEEQARAAREKQQRRADIAAAPAAPASTTNVAPAAAAPPAGASPPSSARAAPTTTTTRATTTPAPAVTGADWICPVRGPRAFSNDYGAPRSGGTRHQGNDILSPRGTPVVANVGGVVTQRTGAVSGLAYFLVGDDDNEYFGAHMESFGASGRVAAGTVIGTIGNSGDAAGGPTHLHFEIHPGGNGYTNPFPTLTKYC